MKKRFLHLQEDMSARARLTFWPLSALLMVFTTTSVVYVVALAPTGAWQLKIALAATLWLIVIASIDLWLNCSGRGTPGVSLDLGAIKPIFPLLPVYEEKSK